MNRYHPTPMLRERLGEGKIYFRIFAIICAGVDLHYPAMNMHDRWKEELKLFPIEIYKYINNLQNWWSFRNFSKQKGNALYIIIGSYLANP